MRGGHLNHEAKPSGLNARLSVQLYGGPEGQSSGSSLNRSSQSSGSSLNRSSRSVLVAECFICLFNFNHKALASL